MELEISWFAFVAILALLFVVVCGLANPRTRLFVIGLGAFLGLSVFFLLFSRHAVVREETAVQESVRRPGTTKLVTPKMIEAAPAAVSPKGSAAETERLKMTLLAALRQAVVQALEARDVARDPEYRVPRPAKTNQPDVPGGTPGTPSHGSQPPEWVNAAPKMEDSSYQMTVRVGPFTTPLECERELLPGAVQGAVAEYAELSLGPEAAAVRLSDNDLQQLVRDRWTEVRPMEIDGGRQDMISLHALVVFDTRMQQQIKSEAQRLVIGRRVRGAAVIFGGLLGLLALAWGGLKLATKRQEKT